MNFGITELLLIALIVFLLFGTKKLRGMGGDIGSAIRDFKKAMKHEDDDKTPPSPPANDIEPEKLHQRSAEEQEKNRHQSKNRDQS